MVHNGIYRFTSVKYPDKALNVYGNNAAENMLNVCLCTDDPSDAMQKWDIVEVGKKKRMRSFVNPEFALDRSTARGSKNNAQLYKTSQSTYEDQVVKIFTFRGHHYKIKLPSLKLYLTAANDETPIESNIANANLTTANSNVYWGPESYLDEQMWKLEKVDGGSTPTGKEVIVTGMPDCKYYPNGKEYFHPTSGMVAGTFYGTNKGQTAILNKIAAFYEKVFGITPSGVDKYAYSLFGSKTVSNDKFNGTYHHGVDMNNYDGADVRTAHAGKLIYASGNRIAIYDRAKNVTYLYLHTLISNDFKKLIGKTVGIGTYIGTQSNQGLSEDAGTHMHFEVKVGENSTAEMPSKSLTTPLPSLNPYKYM